jgi:hypothetical protein
MEVIEPGGKASFTENWYLIENEFPRKGTSLDLEVLAEKVESARKK